MRRGQSDAVRKALARIATESVGKAERIELIRLFGEVKQPQSVPVLLGLVQPSQDAAVCKAALTALQQYDEPGIGEKVAAALASLSPDAQTAGFALLSSRPAWAKALLLAVDHRTIAKRAVPQDALLRIKGYADPEVAELTHKLSLVEQAPTTAEMQAKIKQLEHVLEEGSASPYEGQKVFGTACAVCHTLFSQGGKIGPDLTTAKRDDLSSMLLSIVNPSAEIREGYENYLVSTKDGRTLSGFLADKDNSVIVLRGLDGENNIVAQDQISAMKAAGVSLMPEG